MYRKRMSFRRPKGGRISNTSSGVPEILRRFAPLNDNSYCFKLLVLFTQQVVHSLHRVECAERYFNEDS